MPYKIYTYEDPYRLDQTEFWQEISALPHFCVARTLVNGLKDVLKDKIQGLICPLDDLVKHKDVYKNWTDNVGQRIRQYSYLSALFRAFLDQGRIDKAFYMALVQNQNHFLEALRLLIELGMEASDIDKTAGNEEQKLLVDVLDRVQSESLFQFPAMPGRERIRKIFLELAQKEVDECRGPKREKERCERAAEVTEKQELSAVVVHGVHQFSPVQLRLLNAMEKMGVTVIFLFNYQKKYPKLYSSWNEIYGCFDVPLQLDTAVKECRLPTMQNASNALACAMGALYEGRQAQDKEKLQKWHRLYSGVELIEFANITEYAHYVSDHFEQARQRYSDSRGVIDRGNDVWSNAAVLRFLDEQVYTANRDVHTLLKIYYPEYAKDRHFLSYPIGQFFSAIYRLWDPEKGEILFDAQAIKECLSSNILRAGKGEYLLRTFYELEILFEHVKTYREFKNNVEARYLRNYDQVSQAKAAHPAAPLRQMSIYNRTKVSRADITALFKAIDEINEIAGYLFVQDDPRAGQIDFGLHFQNLEDFLKQRELTLANEQERALIEALKSRLDTIRPERSDIVGTLSDLRQGLHFYLKQKKDEDESVDWIVKNFEQIDGDILQSQGQFQNDVTKVYHFACVSDLDMNKGISELLPWPLTDEFIINAYTSDDLAFQVYHTALSDRSSFLRYALFYGLYFNRGDVKLSYVKQYDDELTEPYTLLSLLGLRPRTGVIEDPGRAQGFSVSVEQDVTRTVRYDRTQMMEMFLCPARFFFDYTLEDSPVIRGSFLYKQFYENLLIEAVWKRIKGWPCERAARELSKVVEEESRKLEPYFDFWTMSEIYDLRLRAQNYLSHHVVSSGDRSTVRPYDQSHMHVREQFGLARFDIDITDFEPVNPYPIFEEKAVRKYPQKTYSLHRIPKAEAAGSKDLCDGARQYLNEPAPEDERAVVSEWCTYCVQKGICLEPFNAKD